MPLCQKLTGWDLLCCYFPISKADHDHLMSTLLTYQIAFADYIGDIRFNPPKDPRLTFIQQITLHFSSPFTATPLRCTNCFYRWCAYQRRDYLSATSRNLENLFYFYSELCPAYRTCCCHPCLSNVSRSTFKSHCRHSICI